MDTLASRSGAAAIEDVDAVVVRPNRGWRPADLAEVWRFRELVWFLAWRDVKVRYKQTVLGALWAILQPLMTMVVFAVLFGLLMPRGDRPGARGVPYSISTFCALLPWQLFANAMTQSGTSLLSNQHLITKVYFPRLIVPLSSVLAGLADFAVQLAVLLGMMLWFGLAPGAAVVALPLFVALALLSALAAGLWLSALSAIYRDFRYTIPFLVQAGMFVTPVVYASDRVLAGMPRWVTAVYGLNPMAGVVEGFRWALLGAARPSWLMLAPSTAMVLVLLLLGLYYFRRVERTFADVV
jgi:lipopolysaccharide transport system permease protein